jgi:hypothetical protein
VKSVDNTCVLFLSFSQAVWGVFIERVESSVTNDAPWDAALAASVEAAAALALRAVRVPAIANDVPRFLSLLSNMPGAFVYVRFVQTYTFMTVSLCRLVPLQSFENS